MCSERKCINKLPHHAQQEYALNRPPYRQGRKLTAVKVYTVNDESQHLLIFGVPQIKLKDELFRLASRFGIVKSLSLVSNYEKEEKEKFTDSYHLHYRRIQAARYAKKQLDERCFFGGVLHVCYAPELETVSETRMKLIQRRREVAGRIEANKRESLDLATKPPPAKRRIFQRSKKHPALPQSEFSTFNTHLSNSSVSEDVKAGTSQSFLNQISRNIRQECEILKSQAMPTLSNQQLQLDQSGNITMSDVALPMESSSRSNESEYKANEGNQVLSNRLSEENIKALKFVPRQINSIANKATNEKRIVFYRQK